MENPENTVTSSINLSDDMSNDKTFSPTNQISETETSNYKIEDDKNILSPQINNDNSQLSEGISETQNDDKSQNDTVTDISQSTIDNDENDDDDDVNDNNDDVNDNNGDVNDNNDKHNNTEETLDLSTNETNELNDKYELERTISEEIKSDNKLEELKNNNINSIQTIDLLNNEYDSLIEKNIENDEPDEDKNDSIKITLNTNELINEIDYSQINGKSENHLNENIPFNNNNNNDESSCSSTSSSSSSQNLIIDQQDPPDKITNPIIKNIHKKEEETSIDKEFKDYAIENSEKIINDEKTELILHKDELDELNNNPIISPNKNDNFDITNPLKRKLSFIESNDENIRNKIFHFDQTTTTTTFSNPNYEINNTNLISPLKNNNKSDEILNLITKIEKNTEKIFNENEINLKESQYAENIKNNLDKGGGILNQKSKELYKNNDDTFLINNRKLNNRENFEELQQYNGDKLIAADFYQQNIKEFEYKCFKCLNVNYETLSELREHQKYCVFGNMSSKINSQINLQNQSENIIQKISNNSTTTTNYQLINQQDYQPLNMIENQYQNKLISSILQPPLIEPFSILPPPAPSRNLAQIVQEEFAQIPQLILPIPPPPPPPPPPPQSLSTVQQQNYQQYRSQQLSANKNIDKIKNSTILPVKIDNSLSSTTAKTTTGLIKKKKYFLCSTCGTYHQNWNLFLHMREIHKRHICLYCLGMFPSAEHLTLHLEMKHDLEQNHFDCQDKLLRSSSDQCFLMCCTCEHIFAEHEEFSDHKCLDYMLPCPLCGQKGKHNITCKSATNNNNNSKKQKDRTKKNNNNNNKNKNMDNNKIINENKLKLTNKQQSNNLNKQINNNNKLDNTFNNINETIKNIIDLKSSINLNNNQNKSKKNNNNNDLNKMINNNKRLENKEFDDNSNNKLKRNGYLEHGNFDYDLINLYKSNRIAIMKKEQEQQQQKIIENNRKESLSSNIINDINELHQKSNKINIFNDDYNNIEINTINNINYDNHDTINNNYNLTSQKYNNNNLHINNSTSILENRLTMKPINNTTQIITEQENNNLNENNNLIVPKFKLKIPKEYQQNKSKVSIESEHSTTESDSDNENDISMLSEKNNENNSKNTNNNNSNNESFDSLLNNNNNNKSFDENIKNNDSDMDIDVTCNNSETYLPIQSDNTTTDENSIIEKSEESITIDDISKEQNIDSSITENLLENQSDLNKNSTDLSQLQSHSILPPPLPPIIEQNQDQIDGTKISLPSSPSKIIEKSIPSDGIELAEDDTQILELCLDMPLDKIPMIKFLRICLKSTYPTCLYCNHARRIAVNGHSLTLHILALHRFSATVDSITAEELLPTTIITKLKSFLPDLQLYYFNMNSYCNINQIDNIISIEPGDEKLFECFQCRFATTIHKELYLHNRKMHLRTAILCFMCRSNFYSYSEILCHICPGTPNKVIAFNIKFRCCLCDLDDIPSAFRLMVHLRKKHFACDVCLEYCHDQSRLSSHVWKHKLHHLCYRCGIAYRNKPDITKHLFWKHGTESVMCKRCLQKRWPHVYHFCIPPQLFACEICNLSFSRAMYLKVHKRLHSGDAPYPCTGESCDKKFISRKLLLKHVADIHAQPEIKEIDITIDQKTPSRRTSSATTTAAISIKDEPMDDLKNEKLSIKNEDDITKPLTNNDKCLNDNVEFTEMKSTNINDSDTPTKKKKKKTKRENKESLEDLNLQVPNLSESDSSDESDSEKKIITTKTETNDFIPNVMLSPASEVSDDENGNGINIDKTDANKILDIWENFKSFQAQQPKIDDDDNEFDEDKLDLPVPILHVVQSDHDYCRMFRPLTNDNKSKLNNETVGNSNETFSNDNYLDEFKKMIVNSQSTPTKQEKSKNKSDSSSSGSSSSSDSSCSCGSNCSCSSSSNSSSDSSSSNNSDLDSSSSEGKRRIAKKRAAKRERQRLKNNNNNSGGGPLGGTDNNSSENIDVVTNESNKSIDNILTNKLEPIVLESDLETDESDTDEDFYDDHPQKLANDLLAEKRRLLMQQTSLSPSHNFDIVENSRPSTPSLPEEILNREKKQKIKKKKRERKASSKNIIPPFKLNIPQLKLPNNSGKKSKFNKLNQQSVSNNESELIYNQTVTTTTANPSGILQSNNNLIKSFMSPGIIDLLPPANLMASGGTPESIHAITPPRQQQQQIPVTNQSIQQPQQSLHYNQQQSIAGSQNMIIGSNNMSNTYSLTTHTPLNSTKHRLSTGSSSDADGSLKRSKRARRPNRFYGYSSDDDTPHHSSNSLSGVGINSALFKPTPPPNLTWCKEDLPTPSKSILSNKNYKSSPQVDNVSGSKKQTNSLAMKRQKTKKENTSKVKRTSLSGTKLLSTSTPTTPKSSFPPIPTLKIRPSAILPQVEPSVLDHPQTQYYQHQQPPPPPVVANDPLIRVPPVPVHHIEPPSCYPSSRESIESSDSSDEEKLTIPVNIYKTPKSKNKTPKTGLTTKSNSKKLLPSSITTTTPNVSADISSPIAGQIPPTSIASPAAPTPTIFKQNIPPALLPNPDLATLQYFKRNNIRYPIRPPAGARAARDGESVYCYCRCPYDEVSEMIACDGDNCMIEWFHFECVGIYVAPQGKWFCAECKPKQPQQQPVDNYQHLSAAAASSHYLGY